MSILTKALVVLVTIAACVCMALMVSFAANVDYSDTKLKSAQTAAQTASARAEFIETQLSNLSEKLTSDQRSHLNTVAGLEADLSGARSTIRDKEREITDLKSQLDAQIAMNTRLVKASQDYAQLIEVKDTELANLREKVIQDKDTLVSLTDANDELMAKNRMLERKSKRDDELNKDLTTQVAKLETALQSGTTPGTAAGPGGPKTPGTVTIIADVTQVSTSGNETFVQINAGSRDKVAVNSVFLLYRGETYLGTLVIDNVDTTEAVGRLRNKSGQSVIQAGDKALAGPNIS